MGEPQHEGAEKGPHVYQSVRKSWTGSYRHEMNYILGSWIPRCRQQLREKPYRILTGRYVYSAFENMRKAMMLRLNLKEKRLKVG